MSGKETMETRFAKVDKMSQHNQYTEIKKNNIYCKIPIYSWMDENCIWWSSMECGKITPPIHFGGGEWNSMAEQWVVKHSNYQEVTKLQKAIRSA